MCGWEVAQPWVGLVCLRSWVPFYNTARKEKKISFVCRPVHATLSSHDSGRYSRHVLARVSCAIQFTLQ